MADVGAPKAVQERDRASVTWHAISVTAKRRGKEPKKLLDNVSGCVEPGQALALMGPSGSGKTTLLDVLAGRTHRNLSRSGDIRVNGHATKMSYGTVAYVPQDDLLTGTLTVRETLMSAANLRLKLSSHEKKARVEQTMRTFGLTSAASTPVGTVFIKGLSGGQKRRLSIACEALVQPSILFLDEPTSGLDSASAFFCVTAVKKLAAEGRTVIMSVHQPSAEVFDLFDTLLLLSGGEQIFFGPARMAGQFYADAGAPCPPNRALADHFIFAMNKDFERQAKDFDDEPPSESDLESFKPFLPPGAIDGELKPTTNKLWSLREDKPDASKSIQALRSAFETRQRGQIDAKVRDIDARGGAQHQGIVNNVNVFSQFLTLLRRMLVNSFRDIGVFWLRLGMYVGLCVALGTIYFDLTKSWSEASARGGLIFFTVSFLTFMSVSGFPSFVDDMAVFVRERLNGYYGVAAYTAANTVSSLPFLAVMAVLCSLVVYFLSGLNRDSGRVGYFMLNLWVALFTVEGLMMAIAAVVPHYLLGLAAGAGLLGMFMPIAGYVIPVDDIPKPFWRYPMHYLGYHTYSLNGMMNNEFLDTDGWGCPCEITEAGCAEAQCTITGEGVLHALRWNVGRSKWWDIGVMCLMALVFRVFFFLMLKLREAVSKQ